MNFSWAPLRILFAHSSRGQLTRFFVWEALFYAPHSPVTLAKGCNCEWVERNIQLLWGAGSVKKVEMIFSYWHARGKCYSWGSFFTADVSPVVSDAFIKWNQSYQDMTEFQVITWFYSELRKKIYCHSCKIYYYLSSPKMSQILTLMGSKTDDCVKKIFVPLNFTDLWLVYCVLNKKNSVSDWHSFEYALHYLQCAWELHCDLSMQGFANARCERWTDWVEVVSSLEERFH